MVNWQGPQSLWQYVHYTRPKSNIETENHRKIHRNIFLLSFGGWGNSRELPEPKNGNKKDHHPKHRVRGAMSVLFVICCPGSYCHIQIFMSAESGGTRKSSEDGHSFEERHWSWTMSIFHEDEWFGNCRGFSY